MTFDEQLKHAFAVVTERLREEIDRQVRAAAEELSAAVAAEREQAAAEARLAAARDSARELEPAVAAARQEAHDEALAAGLAQGRREGHDEGHRDGREAGHRDGVEEGRRAGFEDGRREGVEEGRRAGVEEGRGVGFEDGRRAGFEDGRGAGFEDGRRAGFEDGRREGLEDGRRAGLEEGRRDGREQGHRDGLEEGRRQGLDEARQQVADTPPPAPPADHAAVERLAASVRAIGNARSLTDILDALVQRSAREAAYARVWVVRGAALRHWRSAGSNVPQDTAAVPAAVTDAARANGAVNDGDGTALPIAISNEVVAVLYAAHGETRTASRDAIDVLAQYAARCLEALTAFKAARAVSERSGGSHLPAAAASDAAAAEEDASARRYARLLVSEIKLYHESAVLDGRRDRDLASRLGGEIARARVLYEERVPAHVRQRGDYFHDELVRTLADGDATLLQLT